MSSVVNYKQIHNTYKAYRMLFKFLTVANCKSLNDTIM